MASMREPPGSETSDPAPEQGRFPDSQVGPGVESRRLAPEIPKVEREREQAAAFVLLGPLLGALPSRLHRRVRCGRAFVALAACAALMLSSCAPLLLNSGHFMEKMGPAREEVRRGDSIRHEPDALAVQLGDGRVDDTRLVFEPRVAPRCLSSRVDEVRTRVDVSADYVESARDERSATGTLAFLLASDLVYATAAAIVTGLCFSGAEFCNGEDGQNALITGGAIAIGAVGTLDALILGGAFVYRAAKNGERTVATRERHEVEGLVCGDWKSEPVHSVELGYGPQGVTTQTLAEGRAFALEFANVRPSALSRVAVELNGERLPWIPNPSACLEGADAECAREVVVDLPEHTFGVIRSNLERRLRTLREAEIAKRCGELDGTSPTEPLYSISEEPALHDELPCGGRACDGEGGGASPKGPVHTGTSDPDLSNARSVSATSNGGPYAGPRDLLVACAGARWILVVLEDDLEHPLKLAYMARELAETEGERETRLVRSVHAAVDGGRFEEAKRITEALSSPSWLGPVRLLPRTLGRLFLAPPQPLPAAVQLRAEVLLGEGTKLLAEAREARSRGNLDHMRKLLFLIPDGLEDVLVGLREEWEWAEAQLRKAEAQRLEKDRRGALERARQAERRQDYETAFSAYSLALDLTASEAERNRIRSKLEAVYPLSGDSIEEFTGLLGDESAYRKLRKATLACKRSVGGIRECALKRRFARDFFSSGTLAFRGERELWMVIFDVRGGNRYALESAFEFLGINERNQTGQQFVGGRIMQTYRPGGGYQVAVSAGSAGAVVFLITQADQQ